MVLQASPVPVFLTCSTRQFEPKEHHVTRFCTYSVLILMREGVLRFREAGTDVELHPGEYYIQRQGNLQEGILPSDAPLDFYVEFRGSYHEQGGGLPLRGKWEEASILPLTQRLEMLYRGRRTDLFRLNADMLRIFSALYAAAPKRDARAEMADRIKSFLEAEYTREVSLDGLASVFGYSKDHLIRIYKDHFGVTPHQYLIRVRMEHAAYLLENTSLSAEQVAASVGYMDFSAFYRAFYKIYQVSPRRYQRNPG